MKIEIDTKHDSPEEIRKVIKMLQHLVGEQPYANTPNIFEDPNSFDTSSSEGSTPTEATNAFVNMFGSASESREPKEEPMQEPKEEKEEIPKVIPY